MSIRNEFSYQRRSQEAIFRWQILSWIMLWTIIGSSLNYPKSTIRFINVSESFPVKTSNLYKHLKFKAGAIGIESWTHDCKQDTKVERLHEPYAKIEKSWTLDNTVTIMVRRRNDAQNFLSNRQQGNCNFSQNFLHTCLPEFFLTTCWI